MVCHQQTVGGKLALTWLKWSCLLLSIGSLVVAVWLMLGSSKGAIQQLMDSAAIMTGTSIKHLDMSEYKGDRLLWHLQADNAVEEGQQVLLRFPVLDLYSTQGELMPIRAHTGVYDKQVHVMHFEGEVQVNYLQWSLTSETLDFYEEKDEIHVLSDFILQEDGVVISGQNMKVSRPTGMIQVFDGVRFQMEGLE